jgi:hypothetical protein
MCQAPPCSSMLPPGDTSSMAGTGASYSASCTYDAANRLTSSPLGAYSHGASGHGDAPPRLARPGAPAKMRQAMRLALPQRYFAEVDQESSGVFLPLGRARNGQRVAK